MNKLAGMLAFMRVVESGGFTGAAHRLGTSVSAVTKNVSRLERELGTQLLSRTTRRFAITEFGRQYYSSCRRVFDEIDEVETALRQSQELPRGRLTMLCPAFFARVTILPRLEEFHARYPDIELDITTAERSTDLLDAGANLAVVVGEQKDSRFATRTLVRGPRVCCATPDYLRRHGTPKKIDDLHVHNCLVSRSALWQFREGGKPVEIAVSGNLVVRSGDVLRAASSVRRVALVEVSTQRPFALAYSIISKMRRWSSGSPHECSTTASAHGAISSITAVKRSHSMYPFGRVSMCIPVGHMMQSRLQTFVDSRYTRSGNVGAASSPSS